MMEDSSVLCKVLHFRSDIGDGLRCGFLFYSCTRDCHAVCLPEYLTKSARIDHENGALRRFTPHMLGRYLEEERLLCATKPLGVTFLRGEPLESPGFCREAGKIIQSAGMNLQIDTCGAVSQDAIAQVLDVCDTLRIRFFSPVAIPHPAYRRYPVRRVTENLQFLERCAFSYRMTIPVLPGVNDRAAQALAAFLVSFPHLKSISLDFSASGFCKEEILSYRSAFLKKRIPLY